MQEGSLEELIIFPAPPELGKQEFIANWTSNQTKVLLDLYKKYRSRVGSYGIKNFKKLWEVISKEINAILKTNYNSSHVENRWRVVVDNQNKTGRGKQNFEYEEEMNGIFEGKKNVKPDVLLSTDTIEHLVEESEPIQSTSSTLTAAQAPEKSFSLKRKRNPVTNRNLTIEQFTRDRKDYNWERIKVKKEKLEVQKQKIILMKERNELLRERNDLLRNRTCSACSRDFI